MSCHAVPCPTMLPGPTPLAPCRPDKPPLSHAPLLRRPTPVRLPPSRQTWPYRPCPDRPILYISPHAAPTTQSGPAHTTRRPRSRPPLPRPTFPSLTSQTHPRLFGPPRFDYPALCTALHPFPPATFLVLPASSRPARLPWPALAAPPRLPAPTQAADVPPQPPTPWPDPKEPEWLSDHGPTTRTPTPATAAPNATSAASGSSRPSTRVSASRSPRLHGRDGTHAKDQHTYPMPEKPHVWTTENRLIKNDDGSVDHESVTRCAWCLIERPEPDFPPTLVACPTRNRKPPDEQGWL